jgi:hypothetical protein
MGFAHHPEPFRYQFLCAVFPLDPNDCEMKTPRLMPDGKVKGRPRSALVAIIAAVAEAKQIVLSSPTMTRISRDSRSLIGYGTQHEGGDVGNT